ncbi:hypothetical protein ABG768_004020 [Culter alburnus]|uniref:Uncharacterized protein n=1 Tax=Culter alburnus TaxID=194366 RepID=A0AAW2A0E5_CULAL
MTTVAAEFDHMDIQQTYQDSVNNRWEDEWDNENSSARLFERSRIKALAGALQQKERGRKFTLSLLLLKLPHHFRFTAKPSSPQTNSGRYRKLCMLHKIYKEGG